jgi:transcriptional regulator GlxA family with amidase domain
MLEDNLGRSITLDEMAKLVNLTPEHLCRLFKAQMGGPPAKHLKMLRLQTARRLLETTCLRVKEVMWAVGINDESHFVRDFESAYGLPPTQYRRLTVGVSLPRQPAAAEEVKNG